MNCWLQSVTVALPGLFIHYEYGVFVFCVISFLIFCKYLRLFRESANICLECDAQMVISVPFGQLNSKTKC